MASHFADVLPARLDLAIKKNFECTAKGDDIKKILRPKLIQDITDPVNSLWPMLSFTPSRTARLGKGKV